MILHILQSEVCFSHHCFLQERLATAKKSYNHYFGNEISARGIVKANQTNSNKLMRKQNFQLLVAADQIKISSNPLNEALYVSTFYRSFFFGNFNKSTELSTADCYQNEKVI